MSEPMPEIQRQGLVYGMDAEVYHTGGTELSHSAMKHLLRSPKHFRYYMDTRATEAPRPAFDFGTAVHTDVLGTGTPRIVIPESLRSGDGGMRTKEARQWLKDVRAEGYIPVTPDVAEKIDAAVAAILANPKARRLLTRNGKAEVSAFATEQGVRLRARIDWLTDTDAGDVVPVDVKTTQDVRRHKIRSTIEEFSYDLQGFVYRRVLGLCLPGRVVRPMQLIFVESAPPHEVRVVQLAHDDWQAGGKLKMDTALARFSMYQARGEWPGDDDAEGTPESLAPSPWYLDRIGAE